MIVYVNKTHNNTHVICEKKQRLGHAFFRRVVAQICTGSPPGIPLMGGSCKSPCARKKTRYIKA